MDLTCGFGVWGVAEAKNLPLFLVDPILVVIHAILALHFDVVGVGFRNIFSLNSSRDFVNVHVGRHIDPLD